MSDKPISVGDLVQVVRPPQCPAAADPNSDIGRVFKVSELVSGGAYECSHCFGLHQHSPAVFAMESGVVGWAIYRLKRIQPLEELDDVKQDEEITA